MVYPEERINIENVSLLHEHLISWSSVLLLAILGRSHGCQWVVVKLVLPSVHGVGTGDNPTHLSASVSCCRVFPHFGVCRRLSVDNYLEGHSFVLTVVIPCLVAFTFK